MDQAQGLREKVKGAQRRQILAITSGKGGVGKTTLSVNLALAMQEMRQHPFLIDADVGLGNVDILLGQSPSRTLLDVVSGRVTLVDAIQTHSSGIRWLAGGNGWVEGLDEKHVIQINEFTDLSGPLLIDTGAGIGNMVFRFLASADEIVLVTTPDPTALADAYALLKRLHKNGLEKNVWVIVNRCVNLREAENIFERLRTVSLHFLGVPIKFLGAVQESQECQRAGRGQTPFMISEPQCLVARQVRQLAYSLLQIKPADPRGGLAGFFSRLIGRGVS